MTTIFTNEEKQTAEELVLKIINLKESTHDSDDEIEELYKSQEFKDTVAIPSQFYFYFPDNTYENRQDNVPNGIDSPFVFKKGKEYFNNSYSICFESIHTDEIDLYLADMLDHVSAFPKWLYRDDEYHWSFSETNGNGDFARNMTVKEITEYLISLGFIYQNSGVEEDCLFGDDLDNLFN